MKKKITLQQKWNQRADVCSQIAAKGVGAMYVRFYDCMLFMRLFI